MGFSNKQSKNLDQRKSLSNSLEGIMEADTRQESSTVVLRDTDVRNTAAFRTTNMDLKASNPRLSQIKEEEDFENQ